MERRPFEETSGPGQDVVGITRLCQRRVVRLCGDKTDTMPNKQASIISGLGQARGQTKTGFSTASLELLGIKDSAERLRGRAARIGLR